MVEPEVLAAGTINADSLLCLDAVLQTGASVIAAGASASTTLPSS